MAYGVWLVLHCVGHCRSVRIMAFLAVKELGIGLTLQSYYLLQHIFDRPCATSMCQDQARGPGGTRVSMNDIEICLHLGVFYKSNEFLLDCFPPRVSLPPSNNVFWGLRQWWAEGLESASFSNGVDLIQVLTWMLRGLR